MHQMLMRAKEEQDLFWLSMGFDSSDGERDEDFNSHEESDSAKEDSFDSDFGADDDGDKGKKKKPSKRVKKVED